MVVDARPINSLLAARAVCQEIADRVSIRARASENIEHLPELTQSLRVR
jgi:hypothetical protein